LAKLVGSSFNTSDIDIPPSGSITKDKAFDFKIFLPTSEKIMKALEMEIGHGLPKYSSVISNIL
jgi:ribosomal protein L11